VHRLSTEKPFEFLIRLLQENRKDKRMRRNRQTLAGRLLLTAISMALGLIARKIGKSILDFDAFSKGARAYKQAAREIIAWDEKEKSEKVV
jgi:DNA modification methylase